MKTTVQRVVVSHTHLMEPRWQQAGRNVLPRATLWDVLKAIEVDLGGVRAPVICERARAPSEQFLVPGRGARRVRAQARGGAGPESLRGLQGLLQSGRVADRTAEAEARLTRLKRPEKTKAAAAAVVFVRSVHRAERRGLHGAPLQRRVRPDLAAGYSRSGTPRST